MIKEIKIILIFFPTVYLLISGCSSQSNIKPVNQMTVAELCSESGRAFQFGNEYRYVEVNNRLSQFPSGSQGINQITCSTLAEMGKRKVISQQIQEEVSRRQWEQIQNIGLRMMNGG